MIDVHIAREATPELAQDLGALMPHLSSRHEGSPIDSRIMDLLTDAESFTLFTADLITDPASDEDIITRRLVGASVLHRVGGLLDNDAVWLESFVADPDVRGQGIGQKIWDTMDEWRKENGLFVMKFTSKATREKAHDFYRRNGCEQIATGKTTLFEHRIDPIARAKQKPVFWVMDRYTRNSVLVTKHIRRYGAKQNTISGVQGVLKDAGFVLRGL